MNEDRWGYFITQVKGSRDKYSTCDSSRLGGWGKISVNADLLAIDPVTTKKGQLHAQ